MQTSAPIHTWEGTGEKLLGDEESGTAIGGGGGKRVGTEPVALVERRPPCDSVLKRSLREDRGGRRAENDDDRRGTVSGDVSGDRLVYVVIDKVRRTNWK